MNSLELLESKSTIEKNKNNIRIFFKKINFPIYKIGNLRVELFLDFLKNK